MSQHYNLQPSITHIRSIWWSRRRRVGWINVWMDGFTLILRLYCLSTLLLCSHTNTLFVCFTHMLYIYVSIYIYNSSTAAIYRVWRDRRERYCGETLIIFIIATLLTMKSEGHSYSVNENPMAPTSPMVHSIIYTAWGHVSNSTALLYLRFFCLTQPRHLLQVAA